MPLTDLGEDHLSGEEFQFHMTNGAHRILVRVTREAMEEVKGRSGTPGFEVHRSAFAALASKKFAKGQVEPDNSVLLRARDV